MNLMTNYGGKTTFAPTVDFDNLHCQYDKARWLILLFTNTPIFIEIFLPPEKNGYNEICVARSITDFESMKVVATLAKCMCWTW